MSFSTQCCSCFPHLTTRLNPPISRAQIQAIILWPGSIDSGSSTHLGFFLIQSQCPALAPGVPLLPNFARASLKSSLNTFTQLPRSAPQFMLSEPEPSSLQLSDNYSVSSLHVPPEGMAFFLPPRSLSPTSLRRPLQDIPDKLNTTLPQITKGRLNALKERTANRAITANLP